MEKQEPKDFDWLKGLIENSSFENAGAVGSWCNHPESIRKIVKQGKSVNILEWSTLIATMVVGDSPHVRFEYESLPDNVKNLIHDTGFGNPIMLHGTQTSGSYAHQAYYLNKFLSETGTRLSDIGSIVEFGGGYGAMAKVARLMGFVGEYTIYDLGEFSILQEFYLSNVGADANFVSSHNWDALSSHRKPDLMIGLYSISEVDRNLRERFFDYIEPKACAIAHQSTWLKENLNDYFVDFMNTRPMYNWKSIEHPHPSMSGHYYRIGVIK